MSITATNQLVNQLRENSIDRLINTIHGSDKVKGIAHIINRAFWFRIVFLGVVVVLSIVINLGLLDGFKEIYDWTTLFGTLTLGTTGILAKMGDIKSAFGQKRKVSNNFVKAINILEGQLFMITTLKDPELSCAIKHYKKMLVSLHPLFNVDLDDKDITKKIQEVVDNCSRMTKLKTEDKDYCDKVSKL